jgi:5-methylcytosine-specific restriction endonuclease McrA
MSIVPCADINCHRKVQARGMCSTHYSYWHRANNGRTRPRYSKECLHCGEGFDTTTGRTVYCSLRCAQRARAGHTASTSLVPYVRPRVWVGHTLPERKGKALVAGQCAYCPEYFIGEPNSKYCSERCATNASWKRRYDRRGEFKVTDKLRLAIYERDNFTCQLCNEEVDTSLHHHDRMSATLDHIIPQSWMLIPDHSEANLRLAHRVCNSMRGAEAA